MGRFTSGNQDNGSNGANNANSYNGGGEVRTAPDEEYYGDHLSEQEEYGIVLKDLWLCIAFCIVGWIIACIGFAMIAENDLGILFVLVGVIVVDLPCFKILLAGGSLGMLFGSVVGAERIIHYTDGTTERDNSAWSAGLAVTIFTWIATLIVGVFAMVFRIFKNFLKLLEIKREGTVHTDVKTAPWLPIVVGLGVFVLGLVVVGIVGSVTDYQRSVRDDYSDEESVAILDSVAEGMTKLDWQYIIRNSDDPENPYAIVEQKCYEGYDFVDREIFIKISAAGATYFGIDEGLYIITYNDGNAVYTKHLDGNQLDSALALKLNEFTPAELLAISEMKNDIGKVFIYDKESTQGIYNEKTEHNFTFKSECASGSKYMEFAGGIVSNGIWQIRYVDAPYTWATEEYLEFNYRGYSSIAVGF